MNDEILFDPRPQIACDRLIELLRHAHSGETAAILAYRGHWKSVRDPEERRRLQQIEQDEKDHLEIVARYLEELGVGSNQRRDRVFWCIGKVIGVLCRLGGWFVPMYGAGSSSARTSQSTRSPPAMRGSPGARSGPTRCCAWLRSNGTMRPGCARERSVTPSRGSFPSGAPLRRASASVRTLRPSPNRSRATRPDLSSRDPRHRRSSRAESRSRAWGRE